jgi:hypothetical protein
VLLIPGIKINTPFDLRNVGEQETFLGKEFPTYFRIRLKGVKKCNINRKFRVQYETDANNDYFERSNLPGEFKLSITGTEITDYILNLWNGLATLTASLPESAKVGNKVEYKSTVQDPTQLRPFEDVFEVEVLPEAQISTGDSGIRSRPPSETEGDAKSCFVSFVITSGHSNP